MASLEIIAEYIEWGLAIGTAIITFRVLYTVFNMVFSMDENISASAIWVKVGKQVTAAIIMVSIVSIIELVKEYFFH